MSAVAAPELRHVCDLAVDVGKPLTTGEMALGERRLIPITGGTVTGPRLSGRILPGGADAQILRPGGFTELVARYCIEASDGAIIYVENSGIRTGAPNVMARLKRGEPVDPAQVYFRATPRFETAAPQHAWMMQRLFLCTGVREPTRVVLSIFEV